MENLLPNPILEFKPNQLAEIRNTLGYDTVNKLNQDLDNFQDWIRKQNHFVVREIDRDYLERFLIANKGSVERAKKRFDRLCTLRNLMPEFSHNIDVRNEFSALHKCVRLVVMPKLTKDNYRVVIAQVHSSQDHEFVELLQYYRYSLAFVEYMLCHDYNIGYEYIFDSSNLSFGLISKLNPVTISKALAILEAYGLRLKTMHFLSNSKFFDTVISIFKSGMSEKLRKRLETHTSVESLYKYIPKEMLPEDYGGNEKPMTELFDSNFKQLSTEEHQQRLQFVENLRTDESCRLSSSFNEQYSGVPGSFKSLVVD